MNDFRSESTRLIRAGLRRDAAPAAATGNQTAAEPFLQRPGGRDGDGRYDGFKNTAVLHIAAVSSLYDIVRTIPSFVVPRVSKNVPPLTCYNLDIHGPITIIFGRIVTKKVGNQTILFSTSSI